MTITNIIALLALIVSFYGAILSTVLFFKEKLNLKLIYLDKNYLYFSKKDLHFSDDGFFIDQYYKDTFSIAIKVRILNNSKLPTTINEFILDKTICIDKSSDINGLIPTSFSKYGNYLTYCSFEKVEILKPLITINPYNCVEGYLIFNNIKQIPTNIKISVNTVQKNKTFKLNFKFNDCRKLIQ